MDEILSATKEIDIGKITSDHLRPDPTGLIEPKENTIFGESILIKNKFTNSNSPYLIDNRFEIRGLIGRGGMCNVYKAFDIELKRDVAVKVLNDKYRFDTESDILSRFRSEGSTVANLSHPDIIKIYHTCQDSVLGPVLILELVEGKNLSDLLKDKTLPSKIAASIALRLSKAMDHAHGGKTSSGIKQTSIIHRDLKPGNILIAGDDHYLDKPLDDRFQIKITDFGLGKNLETNSDNQNITSFGIIVGTPSYMAPEQASGDRNLTTAVDIYGLGAILYEMLTGKPPFTGPTISAILKQIIENDPIPPFKLVSKLPNSLSAICLKCLEKSPINRYQSAKELAEDLQRWLDNKPTKARLPGPITQVTRWARKNPVKTLSFVSFCILTGAFVFLSIFSYKQMQMNYKIQNETETLRLKEKLHESSLTTLNTILELLNVDGPLARTSNLEPLHNILQKYYAKLVEDFNTEKIPDPIKLAIAHFSLSDLMIRKGNKHDSTKVLENVIMLCNRVDKSHPDKSNCQYFIGKAYRILGEVQFELGEKNASLENLNKALVIFESFEKEISDKGSTSYDSDEQLALTYHFLGIYYAYTNINLSLKNHNHSISLLTNRLKNQPENINRHRELARGFGYRGDTFLEKNDFYNADKDYWASHQLRKNISSIKNIEPFWNRLGNNTSIGHRFPAVTLDNEQTEGLFQLGRSFANFGSMHLQNNLLSTAEEYYLTSGIIREFLAKQNPNIHDFKYDLANNLTAMSLVRLKRLALETSINLDSHSTEVKQIEIDLNRAIFELYEPVIIADKAVRFIRGQGDARTHKCMLEWLKKSDPDLQIFIDTEQFLEKTYGEVQNDQFNLAKVYAMRSQLFEKNNMSKSDFYANKALNALKTLFDDNKKSNRSLEIKSDTVFGKSPTLVTFLQTIE